jgi:hypothetical protein
MVNDTYKSPESEAAYKEAGLEYPVHQWDKWYADFLKLTRNTKKEDHKMHIQNMRRFIRKSGEEFLIYDMSETKHDPLGNRKQFHRGNLGKYEIVHPRKEVKVDPEEGYAKKVIVTGIDFIEDAYSIPFNKKNVEKLTEYTDGSTSYTISKEDYQSGKRFTVSSYHDWLEGKPEHLLRFGHIASSYEQQVLADEKIGKFQNTPSPTAGVAYR